MTKKKEEEPDDAEDGPDGEPPPSLLRHFPEGPAPTAAELEAFKGKFRVVVRAYSGFVRFRLQAPGIPHALLEDLVQEVFLQTFAMAKRRNIPRDIASVLGVVAKRVRDVYLRDQARKARRGHAVEEELLDRHPSPDPSASFLLLLQEAVDQLPPEELDLLWWFGVEGRSYEEIAAWLGVSVAAAGNRISRARDRLLAIAPPPSDKAPAR